MARSRHGAFRLAILRAARVAGHDRAVSRIAPLAARFLPSPNFGERRGYGRPNCLILHYTGMPTGEAALKALTDPACEVSSHYLVWEDGAIDQLVAESDRAWHAGRGSWKGEADLNSASIGIEIVNPGHEGGSPPFPDCQIEARSRSCATLPRAGRSRPSGFSPIPTSRPRASAIPGKLFRGLRSGGAASAIGPSLRRSPARRYSPMRRKVRRCERCRRCWPSMATAWRSLASSTAKPGRWSQPSSATSGRSGSTARRMLPRSRR